MNKYTFWNKKPKPDIKNRKTHKKIPQTIDTPKAELVPPKIPFGSAVPPEFHPKKLTKMIICKKQL